MLLCTKATKLLQLYHSKIIFLPPSNLAFPVAGAMNADLLRPAMPMVQNLPISPEAVETLP
jgi:hypothetical protein